MNINTHVSTSLQVTPRVSAMQWFVNVVGHRWEQQKPGGLSRNELWCEGPAQCPAPASQCGFDCSLRISTFVWNIHWRTVLQSEDLRRSQVISHAFILSGATGLISFMRVRLCALGAGVSLPQTPLSMGLATWLVDITFANLKYPQAQELVIVTAEAVLDNHRY